MALDLTSFHKALASLGRAIARAEQTPGDEPTIPVFHTSQIAP